jgi:hypothetical protein
MVPSSIRVRIFGRLATFFAFYIDYLIEPTLVTSPIESGGEKNVDDRKRESRCEDAPTESQYVCVVMFPSETRHELALAQGSAYAVNLVGHDCLALATPAEQDAEIRFSRGDCARGNRAELWVIDGILGVGSKVEYLMS